MRLFVAPNAQPRAVPVGAARSVVQEAASSDHFRESQHQPSRCVDLDGDGKEEPFYPDGDTALAVWWLRKPGGLTSRFRQRVCTSQANLVATGFDKDGATMRLVS